MKKSNNIGVEIDDRQDRLSFSRKEIKRLVNEVFALEEIECEEVGIHFVESREMCALHQTYFNDPSETDCISFPLDQEDARVGIKAMGDVFVCTEVAIKYAQEHNIDPYEETALYLIHGLLHLIGYDDRALGDKRKMRRAEKLHLAHMHAMKISIKKSSTK